MDMKKILQAMDGANSKAEVHSSDMKKFLTIVEGKGPLNRPTSAESITMQHYTEPAKKTITAPVLNVAEGATPSMIGKYFKAVEQELREAAERPNDRATRLAKRVIERVTIGPDGKVTGGFKPQLSEPVPAAEPAPAPSNVKPGGATVEYGGSTYSVNVFGDGIRPRIGRSDKVVTAKAYVVGDKMYVLLDPAAQEGVAESERTMSRAAKGYEKYGKAGMTALAKAGRDGASEKKLDAIRDKHDNYNEGSDPCWDSHKMVGTKKKGGKTVPNCVPKK